MEIIHIKINSWEDYNPKRDQKTYTWLRLSNNIAVDPKLFGLSAEQKFLWVMVLCQASEKNCENVSLNLNWLAHTSGSKMDTVEKTIKFLIDRNIIDSSRPQTTAVRPQTTPTNERTNERTNTSEGELPPLASIWNQNANSQLARVKTVRGTRLRNCNARWREKSDPNYWISLITKINTSDFLTGKISAWRADFDWLIKPDSADKILENKYQNHKLNGSTPTFRVVED